MGIHLRVPRESYPMNTNMIGFRWFSKIFCVHVLWTKVASAFYLIKSSTNGGLLYLIASGIIMVW